MALVKRISLFLPVFLRLALREMRRGLQGFYIFLACLAVGVAAIAASGSLGAAINEGMRAEGRAMLGGDVALELNYRDADAAELEFLTSSGELSLSRDMRAMAKNLENDRRTLVELKAVDAAYPLFGAVTFHDGVSGLNSVIAEKDGVWGAAIEAPLAARLGAKVGSILRIGEQDYHVRGIILREPDRASGGLALGPRILVASESLGATGLLQTGSLQVRHYRLKFIPGVNLKNWTTTLNAKFPDTGWRVRDSGNATPSIRQVMDQLSLFLTLVGLTTLVVGGVGAGNAVHGYLQRKQTTIAILKCLGAYNTTIFWTYMAQVVVLALFGIGIGLAVGAVIPVLLGSALKDVLPVPANFGLYPLPLLHAAAFGFATAMSFAIWPLARTQEISAARLFHDVITPSSQLPSPRYIVATVVFMTLLAGLAFLISEDTRFATWFVAGIGATFLLLRLLAHGIMAGLRKLPRPAIPELRLAVANLHRPGTQTPVILLSLGLGLTLLVTLALVEGNIARQMSQRIPEQAPAFFFLDIPSDQRAGFENLVNSLDGASDVVTMPTLRGRITRLGGAAAVADNISPESRWALRGDRVLSYSATQPQDTVLAAGDWWPADYNGPALLSLDAQLAEGMGLVIGDSMTVNVLGRPIEARIASLRKIDWSAMGINFALIFSPGAISAAPHTYIATARATPAAEEALHRSVTNKFPAVSTVRIKETLEAVNVMLANLANAARAAGSVTMISGILVLAGALAAGHRQRVYDAVVMKVLGASRARILMAYVAEYTLLGLCAAGLAGIIGSISAYLVVTELMRMEWVFLPLTLGLTVAGGTVATVLLGLISTWRSLGQTTAAVLRTA